MFKITKSDGYSLAEIANLQKTGVPVLRSAHIGNFNPTTLFLAQEGFPIILHEHIRGDAKIYRPASIRIQENEIQIANKPELPATHLDLNSDGAKKIDELFGITNMTPVQIHYHVLHALFPNNIRSASRALLGEGEFFERSIGILAAHYPHAFANFIDGDGKIFNLTPVNDELLQAYKASDGEERLVEKKNLAELAYGYLHTTDRLLTGADSKKPEGIVMKSNPYIILSSIGELHKARNGSSLFNSESMTILHFAGTQMEGYLLKNKNFARGNEDELNGMYACLKDQMSGEIPEMIDFKLVPTSPIGEFVSSEEIQAKRFGNTIRSNHALTNALAKRNASRNKSAFEVHSEISLLNDHELALKLDALKENLGALPGSMKKNVVGAAETQIESEGYRRLALGVVIAAEIARRDIYTENAKESAEVSLFENQFIDDVHSAKSLEGEQITQYDTFKRGARAYMPEEARLCSIRDLQEIHGMFPRENTVEATREANNDTKPKMKFI